MSSRPRHPLATNQERFDLLTRVSMYILLALAAYVALVGVASVPQATAAWQLLSCAVLAVVSLAVATLTLHRALEHGVGRGHLGPWRWRALTLVSTLSLLWPLIVLPSGAGQRILWGYGATIAIATCLPCVVVLCCATRPRATHALAAATVTVPTAVELLRSGAESAVPLVFAALYALLLIYSGRLSTWMMSVVEELARARATASRLAVAEERLRFSRDLHDVVGRSLSAVAVKSQLAAELSRRGHGERAVTEMEAVHALATESLAEMRQVVAGYRRADLATELDGARAVLASAGVSVEVVGAQDAASLPAEDQQALAWVVREGVTNVVRHSRATRCRIVLERTTRVRLTLSNDGALDRGQGGGSGLMSLRERLAEVGGSLEHHREGEHFVLVAVLGGRIEA